MLKEEEFYILLNDLSEIHGYDFTSYAKTSLKRRIDRLYELDNFKSFKEFRFKVRLDASYLNHFIQEITVNVTDMFRDASFYRDLKKYVFPELKKLSEIKIWHAGCSTGEEVFSMAIFLHEANILNKSFIYGTDINPSVLEKAKTGIFPSRNIQKYSENYILAGGENAFDSYYNLLNNEIHFKKSFLKHMSFSNHNLVSDKHFDSFHLIVCRNVLIYFDKDLRESVFLLFDKCLKKFSYIALGVKETLDFSSIQSNYKQIGSEKIWAKIN